MKKYVVYQVAPVYNLPRKSKKNQQALFAKYVHPWTITEKGRWITENSLLPIEIKFVPDVRWYPQGHIDVYAFFDDDLFAEYCLRFA